MSDKVERSDFIFYRGKDGEVRARVILGDETIWVTQKGLSEIFDTHRSVISKHLNNIFKEGELEKETVCAKIAHTADDGKNYRTNYYNLDAIIAVGYRVNSYRATQFRRWATNVLKEYLIKGYVLDDERLKQGQNAFGKDYFEELLERIREIRASERRFYQKITDLFAQCSSDYDPSSPIAREFFSKVQNKFHNAITGQTAPEIIKDRADSKKPNMGLTSWQGADKGDKILKSDTKIAKNFLSKDEIEGLNLLVDQYLTFAEGLVRRKKIMTMKEWAEKLDAFLEFNEYEVLEDKGRVQKKVADATAEKEYDKFRVIQDREYISDFDKKVREIKEKGRLPEGQEEKSNENEVTSEFDKALGKIAETPPPNQEGKNKKSSDNGKNEGDT